MRFLKKIKLLALSAMTLFLGLIPSIASAQGVLTEGFDLLGWFKNKAADSVVKGVAGVFEAAIAFFATILQTIAGLALAVIGGILDFMLSWNFKITDPEFNRVAEVGWQITRDVANLGFVLALILIAFATILRFQQYGAKKLLVKLIAAALLVNFSFAIAAGFINFSNGLADIFLQNSGAISGGEVDLSNSLMGALGAQNIFIEIGEEDLEGDVAPELGEVVIEGTTQLIAGIFFSAILLALVALILGGFAFMLLIRYVYLTILIILAPLAWLFWVMPGLQHQFSRWWDNFLKWTFFAPTVAFFIYLSILSADLLSGDEWNTIQTLEAGAGITGILQGLMQYGVRIFVLGAIMLGGVFAAESMGVHGASATINAANQGKKRLQGYMGNKARRTRDRAREITTDEKGRGMMEQAASGIHKRIGNMPIVGTASEKALGQLQKRREERRKPRKEAIQEQRERLGRMDDSELKASIKVGKLTHPEDAAAKAMEAAERGLLDEDFKYQKDQSGNIKKDLGGNPILTKEYERMESAVSEMDEGDRARFAGYNPDSAGNLGVSMKEAANAMEDVVKVLENNPSAFKNEELVAELKPHQISKITQEASADNIQIVADSLANAANQHTGALPVVRRHEKRLKNLKGQYKGAQSRGDKQEMARLQKDMGQTKAAMNQALTNMKDSERESKSLLDRIKDQDPPGVNVQ